MKKQTNFKSILFFWALLVSTTRICPKRYFGYRNGL